MPLSQAFWKKRLADLGKRPVNKGKIVRRAVGVGLLAGILAGAFGHNYAKAQERLVTERSIPHTEFTITNKPHKVVIQGKGLEPIKPKLTRTEVAKEAAKTMFARK